LVAGLLPRHQLRHRQLHPQRHRQPLSDHRSPSWLARSNLSKFGYSGVFTRDLFEAEIVLPDAAEPLHIFTTHLKCCEDSDSLQRRAAEASDGLPADQRPPAIRADG